MTKNEITFFERILLWLPFSGYWVMDYEAGIGLYFKEMFGKTYCLKERKLNHIDRARYKILPKMKR